MLEIEKEIRELIEETLSSLGLNIVLIKFTGSRVKSLQIFIEKKDETNVTVEDCKVASQHISAILDVEDIIREKYNLQVSSPGIERPLIAKADFERFAGNIIIVKLKEPESGRKSFQGKLIGLDGEDVIIYSEEFKQELRLNFNNIKSSNIVLTEELYRRILNKGN